MGSLLLLYDTLEKDLARDLKDFLEAIRVGSVHMIPLKPNDDATLAEKEARHFEGMDAAIFLLTPGSDRSGSKYPSPSVNHEMGQAKQKFPPQRVIYLLQKGCNVAAIDQKPYIEFERDNIRSVIDAMTHLVKALAVAGLFPPKNKEAAPATKTATKVDIVELANKVSPLAAQYLIFISESSHGFCSSFDVMNRLKLLKHSQQDINFAIVDLKRLGLITESNLWHYISSAGWDVAKTLTEKIKREGNSYTSALGKRVLGLGD